MAGDGLRRPLNAPPGITPAPGVQPGTTTGIIFARYVIVFGPTDSVTGVFVYAAGTTPGPGNPPVISIGENTEDPYGNTVVPGIIQYGSGGSYSGLVVQGGTSILQMVTQATASNIPPEVYAAALNAGTATEYQVLTILSGEETATGGNAFINLFSQNANATTQAFGELGITGVNIIQWTASAVNVNKPITATAGTAADPTIITTDTGTTATTFGTDWGASGSGANGAIFQLQPNGWVNVAIDVKTTAAAPAAEICAIPAGYAPTTSIVCGALLPTAGGGAAYPLTAFSTGTLQQAGVPGVNGVRYAGIITYPGPGLSLP
jgi:hypothetical protein